MTTLHSHRRLSNLQLGYHWSHLQGDYNYISLTFSKYWIGIYHVSELFGISGSCLEIYLPPMLVLILNITLRELLFQFPSVLNRNSIRSLNHKETTF